MKRAAYFSIRFGKTDRVWASSCRPLLDGSLSATSSLLTDQKRKVNMLEPESSQLLVPLLCTFDHGTIIKHRLKPAQKMFV
jgi:hypothetical protein